jgi:SAM-dependent methyltransferase
MALKSWLRDRYEASRLSSLPDRARTFPPPIQRYFSNIAGYEPAEFVRRLLGPDVEHVLVLGAGGGRDTFWLASSGYEVVSCDLVSQRYLRPLVLGDMAALPLRRARFDAVVLSDVLEHTFQDHEALLECHRVLRPGGQLILNVPLGDDIGEEHVRVYSERTIRRLLESCGFELVATRYRGVFPFLELYVPGVRVLFQGLNLVAYCVLRRSFYASSLAKMTAIDWTFGRSARLRRLARCHGLYISAMSSGVAFDFRQLNQQSYVDQIVGGLRHASPAPRRG